MRRFLAENLQAARDEQQTARFVIALQTAKKGRARGSRNRARGLSARRDGGDNIA
jgi:hypothetical protein